MSSIPSPYQPAPQRELDKYFALLTLSAIGVVFGDIGTSPLYAMRECFGGSHGIPPTHENVFGVLSLITWALIAEVTLKYIYFVMRADNRGEGGVLALMALAAHPQRKMRRNDKRKYLISLGLFGAALLYGDGVITPAISVLSAVEGLNVATHIFEPYIVFITIVILVTMFCFQYRGTDKIGKAFGPIIVTWFLTLGTLGFAEAIKHPDIFGALNPFLGLKFLLTHGWHGFLMLGSVFLVVTGSEALYADMGHFGRRPIIWGWTSVVLPGLLLNYYGQGALLLSEPASASNPFYLLAPSWFLYPLVVLATMATVIASQALITGAFSMSRQAVQLGCLPRLAVKHTSSTEIGQIYVPFINRMLLIATIVVVLLFRTSSNLVAAYGIAVSMTMVITTFFTYFVARELWGWSVLRATLVSGTFLLIDLTFFAANALKIAQGGWVPLVLAIIIFTVMTTWRTGRKILARRLRDQTVPLEKFLDDTLQKQPIRVPGTAIFMTGNLDGTPPALIHNLRHNKILHEKVVLLMVSIEEVPHYPDEERLEVRKIEGGFYRVLIRCGFMETPDVPFILSRGPSYGVDFDLSNVTYFLGRETILASEKQGMAIWREKLFAFMSRNAERATMYYCLPTDKVIEIGLQVEL